jgi:hypothetical protein
VASIPIGVKNSLAVSDFIYDLSIIMHLLVSEIRELLNLSFSEEEEPERAFAGMK